MPAHRYTIAADFSAAFACKEAIEAQHAAATEDLRKASGTHTGLMGLTPDHVKATPEWQGAYRNERMWFNTMAAYNEQFCKVHLKAYRAHMQAAREAKIGAHA